MMFEKYIHYFMDREVGAWRTFVYLFGATSFSLASLLLSSRNFTRVTIETPDIPSRVVSRRPLCAIPLAQMRVS
jgi:hypothetical protein